MNVWRVQANRLRVQVDGRLVQANRRRVQADGRPVQANGRRVQVDGRIVQANGRRVRLNVGRVPLRADSVRAREIIADAAAGAVGALMGCHHA